MFLNHFDVSHFLVCFLPDKKKRKEKKKTQLFLLIENVSNVFNTRNSVPVVIIHFPKYISQTSFRAAFVSVADSHYYQYLLRLELVIQTWFFPEMTF